MLKRIISGGQTGADVTALKLTLEHGYPHGGWCPRGRRSLAGPIPASCQLRETPSKDYLQRTEWNVRDSDGTVIFTLGAEATGGSLKTIEFAKNTANPGCIWLGPIGAWNPLPRDCSASLRSTGSRNSMWRIRARARSLETTIGHAKS